MTAEACDDAEARPVCQPAGGGCVPPVTPRTPKPMGGQAEELNYLRSISLHETVDHLMKRVLETKPTTPEDACYEIHSGAAEMYTDIANRCRAPGGDAESQESDEPEETDELLCGLKRGAPIGEGAFGKVYKALDDLGTVYAVKVLRVTTGRQSDAEDEARAEYSTLRQLMHPNIVSVWNFVVARGRCEIVMSYWAQGSVAHQIKEFGALPPYTVRKYAIQVLQGLEYLHSCKVLHRDLKPGNMLIDCMGSVALTDFGLSTTSLTMEPTSVNNTGEGKFLSIVGSPPYLSPRTSSLGAYSEGSDLWALGCSLLEMATAKIVWSGAEFGDDNHGWDVATYVSMSQQAYATGDTPLHHINSQISPLQDDFRDFIKLVFSAEEEELAPKDVYEHPFLGHRVYPAKRECREQKIPYYKYDGNVDLSGPVTVFLGAKNSLLDEESRKAAVAGVLQGAVSDASPFSSLDIRRRGGEEATRGFNNASLDRDRMYPHRKRPAHTLLSLLNRTADRAEVEPGLPDVALLPRLLHTNDDNRCITISAETIDEVSGREKEAGLSPDPLCDLQENACDPPASEVYGKESFRISLGEIKRLARSTYIGTASGVPAKFFSELLRFTSAKQLQLFWSVHRATPLSKIGDMDEERALRTLLENERSTAQKMVEQLGFRPTAERDSQWRIDHHKWVSRKRKAETHIKGLLVFKGEGSPSAPHSPVPSPQAAQGRSAGERLGRAAEYGAFLERFEAWRQHVALFPYDIGFSSSADAKRVLQQSLTELGTAVCVSQLGYFLVDGSQGNHNQLTPKTPQPVTFLFATGIDFFSPSTTLREASKYLNECPDDGEGFAWRGFQPVARFRLKERIKDAYRAIFSCAKHHGVRNLSMLSMGLGIFLSNIHTNDGPEVREAYFKAQFELLCEVDWGFDGYYLNTGPPGQKVIAVKALEDTLGGGGEARAENYLSCDVVFHSCDAKFLAAELAKRRMSAAMLSPSDCASVTIGQVGTFWETGRGTKYSGEEDFISHTTGVLAREGISGCWGTGETDG